MEDVTAVTAYDSLRTEDRNPRTVHIDRLSTLEMVRLINSENRRVEDAVDEAAEDIAAAVDVISERLRRGGHLVYFGAGTSGRLGIVDASECPPTFGVPHDLVRGVMAGGRGAMFEAVEGAEDSEEQGTAAVDAEKIGPGDAVVCISASGSARFVLGAAKRAGELGAAVIGLCCNPGSALSGVCGITVTVNTGPEVISGSTKLKAGTAQKLVLNIFSTCAMIKTGKVMSNLMINVRPTNKKLVERALRLVMTLSGCGRDEAEKALKQAGDVPGALALLGVSNEAQDL